MSQPLPIGNFTFRDDLCDDLELTQIRQITRDNIYDIDCKRLICQTNFLLEVDLEYPQNLHDSHNDLPLAPEHLDGKLVPNLRDKEHYVLHFRTLDFYLRHGLQLRKIHKVLQFTESNWMKEYIALNTARRMHCKTNFEKCFYKLMVNSLYGKSIENVRKRVNFRLVSDDKKAISLCSKPNYKRYIELDKDNHVIELAKLSVVYDKPIYLGTCILELSKLHMYTFHYDLMKPNFTCSLLYTDTDSLMYFVHSQDVYQDLKSKFVKHPQTGLHTCIADFIDRSNSMRLGLFKDECNGKLIRSFVGLKSKLYSLLFDDDSSVNKCKGVNKAVIRKSISYSDYLEALFKDTQKFVEYQKFKSSSHNVLTVSMKKLCLDAHDDKRVSVDGIKTLAVGHFRTKQNVIIYKD